MEIRTDRFGPQNVDVGDEVTFQYGKMAYKSTKRVTEVQERRVAVEGGGFVYYSDIIQITRGCDDAE